MLSSEVGGSATFAGMVARFDPLLVLLLVAGGALAGCTIDDRAVQLAGMNTGGRAATTVNGGLSPAPAGSGGGPSNDQEAADASTGSAANAGSVSSGSGWDTGSAPDAASTSTDGASDAGVASNGTGTGDTSGMGTLGAPPCSGCVELLVPVTGPAQRAAFRIPFAAPGADFSAGYVVWRVQVPAANANAAFFLTLEVLNGPALGYAGIYESYQLLSSDNFPPGEWVDLTVDVSLHPPPSSAIGTPGFDYAAVESLGLALGTTATFAGAASIRVLLDSVTIGGVSTVQSLNFSAGADGLVLDAYGVPAGTSAPIFHP